MDDDGIGLVLARAAELRLKISNCIHKASLSPTKQDIEEEGVGGVVVSNGDDKNQSLKSDGEEGGGEEEEDYDEEADRLLHIHDALESLEGQLGNLQNLQQQQRYDREIALAEIEYSRKMLLEKLKEYKGEHLEVIHEASNFAGETVEYDNDLLLPPYPSRVPRSLILDNGHLPQLHYARKSVQNGVVTGEPINEAKKPNECGSNQKQTGSTTPRKGFGHFIGLVAKTVFPLVGVACVLTMTSFGQNLGKRSTPLKVLGIFQQPTIKEKKSAIQCPPGKVLVVENGEGRCLVKERVEIPFNSVASKPDINFGSG